MAIPADLRNALATYLRKHERDMFHLLRELVLHQSYSRNKAGVDQVGARIAHELRPLGLSCSQVDQIELGNHLVFRTLAVARHSRQILLTGHMDTVFPPDSGFDWYREEDGRVFGPGVIDMKGGLVAAIFAMKALDHCGLLAGIPLTLICNSDEEIGSPTSTDLIREQAGKSLCGLVFECGGLNGEVVTGRKGKTGYFLDVTGKAGHAAFATAAKASAILELAHKIIAIEQLNDPARQLVVNVGTVTGGVGANTVPEFASAQIDIRFRSRSDGDYCAAQLHNIVAMPYIPGTTATLTVSSARQPMPPCQANAALFDVVVEEATNLGLPLMPETRSGVSDANTIGAAGVPVLDGLGPIGAADHSSSEYMISESLTARTLLAACSIAAIWHHCHSDRLHLPTTAASD